MKRTLIAGAATVALLSGGLGPTRGTASAAPGPAPLNHFTWCPGHPDPLDSSHAGGPVSAMRQAGWDLSVCHDYYYDDDYDPVANVVRARQVLHEGDHVAGSPPPWWAP
jgi:hypothetical protein